MCIITIFAKNDNYIYDYWGEIERSPDTYRVSSVLYGNNLGLDDMLKNPTGLFCTGNRVFIVDSGNNRIIELIYNENKTLSFVRNKSFYASDAEITTTFSNPSDVFVNKDGSFFIADTNNGRVLKLDKILTLFAPLQNLIILLMKRGKHFCRKSSCRRKRATLCACEKCK